MENVVYMQGVKPKMVEQRYRNQRIVLQFDPNAPAKLQWVWCAYVTHTYEFTGSADTIRNAERRARQRIDAAMRLAEE